MSKQFNFKQFSLAFAYCLVLFDRKIGAYQMLPLRASVDLGVVAIKWYSAFPKLQYCWSLTIRLFDVISRGLVGGVLLLCGVFSGPSRLSQVSTCILSTHLIKKIFSIIFYYYFNFLSIRVFYSPILIGGFH